MRLDEATIANAVETQDFALKRWFEGWVSGDGSLLDRRSRIDRDTQARYARWSMLTLVSAETSLCRRLSIPCLLFRDLSPKMPEFYLVGLVER